MSAEIFQFQPIVGHRGAVAFSRRTYTFPQVARLVGLDHYETRTQVEHLRLYAEKARFPLPRNPRVWKREVLTGPEAIGQRSKWCALQVDAWLAGGGNSPQPPAAAAMPAPPPLVRADCAERAQMLARA